MAYTINRLGIDLPGLVQNAFGILTNLALTDDVVYTPGSAGSYDVDTGLVTQNATPISFKAALTRFGETEIDNKVVLTDDGKLLVAALDLQVEPHNTDTLVMKNTTWKVLRTLGVPTNGFWKIHIRRI